MCIAFYFILFSSIPCWCYHFWWNKDCHYKRTYLSYRRWWSGCIGRSRRPIGARRHCNHSEKCSHRDPPPISHLSVHQLEYKQNYYWKNCFL